MGTGSLTAAQGQAQTPTLLYFGAVPVRSASALCLAKDLGLLLSRPPEHRPRLPGVLARH
jgi:hypothetical protein